MFSSSVRITHSKWHIHVGNHSNQLYPSTYWMILWYLHTFCYFEVQCVSVHWTKNLVFENVSKKEIREGSATTMCNITTSWRVADNTVYILVKLFNLLSILYCDVYRLYWSCESVGAVCHAFQKVMWANSRRTFRFLTNCNYSILCFRYIFVK